MRTMSAVASVVILIGVNTGARFPQDFELRFFEGGLPWLDLLRGPVFRAEGECRP